jgi:iron(III) transport system substrate-binding protein
MADGARGPARVWRSAQRWWLLACVLAMPSTACQPAAPISAPAPVSGPAAPSAEWAALVEAAKREGQVTVYGPPGGEYRGVLVEAFERAYPGIKVQATFANSTEITSRLFTERQAGRYLADVMVGGTTSTVVSLKSPGVAVPLRSELILPEGLDEGAWLDGHLWWLDMEEPYTALQFEGQVQLVVYYNPQEVDPSQFRSYWDLLNPRWKGKMAATDVRRPGPGGVPTRFMYKHPELGPAFLERLFREMDLTLSGDQRQLADWVASGQYPLGIFLSSTDVGIAQRQGLPIAAVPAEQFKEGAPLGLGNGGVSLLDRAPHPHAAKLYVNWLLSREGQLAYQQALRSPSLRVDIPKDGIDPLLVPKPGASYVNAGGEEYALLAREVINDLISQALAASRR